MSQRNYDLDPVVLDVAVTLTMYQEVDTDNLNQLIETDLPLAITDKIAEYGVNDFATDVKSPATITVPKFHLYEEDGPVMDEVEITQVSPDIASQLIRILSSTYCNDLGRGECVDPEPLEDFINKHPELLINDEDE